MKYNKVNHYQHGEMDTIDEHTFVKHYILINLIITKIDH